MKLKTLIGAASAMAALMTASLAVAHDEKAEVTKTYDLTGFDEITVEGVYILDVTVGDDFSIETSGFKKDMAKIDVFVKNGALVLGQKDGVMKKKNKNNGVHAVITLPKLEAMEVAGVATGEVSKINTDKFELDFAGVGELELNGRCKDLEIDMAGIGKLDAKRLRCEDVDVDLAGMGEATVYASERINADAAGMGSITVYGKPNVIQKSSAFMSSVKIR